MKKNETRDNIALSDIHVSEGRLRKLDPKLVDTLAESMREQRQLQPILLRHRRDRYDLISGRHRLEAAKKLNMRSIRAEVNFNLNADDMLLAEIDENLMRGELSPAEQSEHLAKRKEIYERKHPETKQHVAGGKARHGLASGKLSFAASRAEATGRDRRTVERGATRGEQSRLKEITGTSLDKGNQLDALAKLEKTDPAKRDALIDQAKAGKKVSATAEIADAGEAKLANNISVRAIAENEVADEIVEWTKKYDPKGTPALAKWLLVKASEDPHSTEIQVARLMSSWKAAGPAARQEFMSRIK